MSDPLLSDELLDTRRAWHPLARAMLGGALYVAAYLILDWISLIAPFSALGVAPWNPSAGLTFALFLRYGPRFFPAAFIAISVADLLFRDLQGAPAAIVGSAFAIAAVYGGAAIYLRDRLNISLRLDQSGDLLALLAVTLVAAAIVAPIVVAIFSASNLLGAGELAETALHFWVGDVIGIAVLTPFLLLLIERGEQMLVTLTGSKTLEHALQLVAIVAGLGIIFGLETVNHFEFSYLLFLPLIWIALRDGLTGATAGIVLTQLGLLAAVQLKGFDAGIVTQFQLLMLAVTVTGLVLGSTVDERRNAIRSLRESEARLQTVVNTAPDAILTFDERGVILSANRSAREMFRFGQLADTAVIESFLPGLPSASEKPVAGREMTAHRADGRAFVADVAVGKALGERPVSVVVVRDASIRKEAEAWLKEHEAELTHLARHSATGELAAALAHELNQPLTALISFARACQAVLESAPNRDDTVLTSARELLDQTVEQASRAGQIIRATREFLSRGDVRRVQARLADLVRAVVDLMRGETVQNQVSIVTQIDPDLPPLLVDPIQVEQVVLNLVRNSIEAMSREPAGLRQITVTAVASAAEPGFAEITVQDTGPGLPTEITERLFTPFTTTKESGMGLGLSISRSIVEAHGGHITIASNDAGHGVTIRFTLPFNSEQ